MVRKPTRRKPLALFASAVPAMLVGTPHTAFSQSAETLEEITVTGSRIVRRDMTAPSPITTMSAAEFDLSSTTSIESVLNRLPQFVPGATQFDSSVQSSAQSTPGAATLNLRGLGPNRNLVLFDGRRAQPGNAALIVDINTVPAAAIANVEVITGGASAVYGPDAMAGVVNFMLRDDFEGMDLNVQTGITEQGDGEEHRIGLLMGMNSANGRGNVMIGLDWNKREAVLQRDRSFYVNGWLDTGNPSTDFFMPRAFFPSPGNPISQDAINQIFDGIAPVDGDGNSVVGTSTEIHFNEDGTPFVVQGGHGYNGPLNCLDNCGPYTAIRQLDNGNLDQWGRQSQQYVSTPLERHSVFLRGKYDVTDNVTAFAQGNYSHVQVTQRGLFPPAITVWQADAVPRDGRELPDALNVLLDSRPDPDAPWALFQVLDYNGPIEPVNRTNVWQVMAGLEGSLRGGDWTWEAYGSRGTTTVDSDYHRMASLQRYQQLLYASNFGQVEGLGFPFIPDAGRGYTLNCSTGLPVFSSFTPSEDCLDTIDTRMVDRSELTQDILEANLQGGLVDLPAGELRFAAGVSYRRNEYQFQPGNDVASFRDNPIGVFASAPAGGKTDVKELYGELLVPVIGDLDLELGYRFSDFSTAGGHHTFKTLFTWRAIDEVSFRGGYQRATRAPNIAELFIAPRLDVVPIPQGDPCSVTTQSPWGNVPDPAQPGPGGTTGSMWGLPANPDRAQVIELCRQLVGNDTSGFDTQTYSAWGPGPEGFHRQNPAFFPLEIAIEQGNPDLSPEKAHTWTLGAVISEPFGWNNIDVAVDYYRIEINDAILPLNVATVYNNCLNWNGESNPTYDINNDWCQLIRRNPVTGDREEVDTPFLNVGTLKTQGIDLSINWNGDVGPGTLSLGTRMNYLLEYKYQLAPGDRIADAKGTLDRGGLFDFTALTTLGYAWRDFSAGLIWRHLSSVESAAASLSPDTTIQGTGSYDLFNLNLGYTWSNYSLRFGIDNLFDKSPRVIGANPGLTTNSNVTNPAFYDVLGRRYFAGLRVSF